MVTALTIIVFVIGYLAIAFEHAIKFNKAASALITGVFCWTIFLVQSPNPESTTEELMHHLGEIASILFFILGAMSCGGSTLIIGSAAGFAVMGMEDVKFGWYLKNIGWLALVGLAAGILMFVLQQQVF